MLIADFLGHCQLADMSALALLTHVMKLVQSKYQTVADRALRLLLAMALRPPGTLVQWHFRLFQVNIHATSGAAMPESY